MPADSPIPKRNAQAVVAHPLLVAIQTSPAAVPAAVALVIMIVWAAGDGGFPVREWYPGGLIMLGLLAVTTGTLHLRWRSIPGPVKVAALALTAFAAWSFLSISWADAKGVAWEGANRTMLYVVAFALFAFWPIRGGTAATLLAGWLGAIAIITGVVLVQVATASNPLDLFTATRLHEPAGYANATAALLLMPAWVGLVLISRRELPWWSRGLIATAVVVLASAAFMCQSRGATYALPIVLLFMFAVGTNRRRIFAGCIPIAAGLAVTWTRVLETDRQLVDGADTTVLTDLVIVIAAVAVAAGVAVAIGALFDQRRDSTTAAGQSIRTAISYLAGVTAVVIVIVTVFLIGNPASRLTDAWESFKQGYAETSSDTRLTSGLGSNRYDFYRVALDSFRENPLTGIGADNFQQDYIERRRSRETPRYPHSVELRTLSQTGLIGFALLALAIGAALLGAFHAIRRGGFDAALATAAATAFVYWLVHGSFDWFFEFAGLGVPAFALLGLAAGLSRSPNDNDSGGDRRSRPAVLWVLTFAAIAAAALSLLLPWRAEVETDLAASQWQQNLERAYARIDRAATLNPLSIRPYAIGGTIALRARDYPSAEHYFRSVLERSPRDAYAAFELGAILSADRSRRAEAIALLERAQQLNPLDPIPTAALRQVRRNRAVSIERFNARMQERAERLAP